MFNAVGTAFRGNTQIVRFNEFDRFTKITEYNDIFGNCSSLESVNLNNITRMVAGFATAPFRYTKVDRIILPNINYIGHYITAYSVIEFILIGDKCTQMEQYALHYRPNVYKACIILASTPPTISGNYNWGTQPIYVPDDSFETYKAAPIWANKASTIRKLSDFTTDFPDSGLEEYLP